MMKPQELVDMLLAAAGGSFQFDCNTALDAVDVVLGVMDDLDALNLILKANKEMLKSETARADKAEQQRDELLAHHWQPIETAPKDGLTYVLLGYWPEYMQGEQQSVCPEIAYWGSDVWITNNGRRLGTRGAFAHTHWMPLPPAPASVKGGA